MTSLRNAVDLLAKILRSHGTTNIKAETFRLAKFNSSDAVSPFWRLLFELTCYCEFGKIDDFTHRAYEQLSSEEIVAYVKREFLKRGYYAPDFGGLPSDMQYGSRELLLAFGWLLSNEQIFEKLAMDRTSALDDDTRGMYEEEILNGGDKNPMNLQMVPGGDVYDRVKQLLWLNSKLRLNLCSLYGMLCQRNRLKHKIHEATVGAKPTRDRDHFSMLEVFLARNPEHLRKSIDLLEKDSERLNNLLVWKDHEGIFWKWMESVLEEKMREPPSGDPNSKTATLESVTLAASERLQESYQTLQDAVVKYEAILEHLERLSSEKSKELSTELLDRISTAIAEELEIQKKNLTVCGPKGVVAKITSSISTEPEFILEKKEKGKPLKQGFNASKTEMQSSFMSLLLGDQNCNTTTDIDDEIEFLERCTQRLEKDLTDKQSYLKTELEKLSEKLADVVCIPPLNRNLNRKKSLQ